MATPMLGEWSKLVLKTNVFRSGVRWYRPRKPMWKGRAKTKMFNIPSPIVLPEEERLELLRLKNIYQTMFRSMRQYCEQEYYLKAMDTGEDAVKHQQEEAEELARLLEENRLENEQTALMREERLKTESEQRAGRLVESMLKLADREKEEMEKANEEIRSKKELIKTLITPERLDAAIDQALANPVSYSFAISLDGSVVKEEQMLREENRGEQALLKQ